MIAGSILGVLAVGTGQGGGGITPGNPGNLLLLGRNGADGFGFSDNQWIAGERLPAIFWTFNIATDNVAYLFQAPRVLIPPYLPNPGTQLTDLYPCAVDGSTLLLAQIDPLSSNRYVAFTRYKYGNDVLRYTDWVAEFTNDFPAIVNVGPNVNIRNVVVINPGKCVVKVDPRNGGQSILNIPFFLYDTDPNFSSGFVYEQTTVEVQIPDNTVLGDYYNFFTPDCVNEWAFDTFNAELSIAFQVVNPVDSIYLLMVKIDTLNYTVLSYELVGNSSPPQTAMKLLTTQAAPANLQIAYENFETEACELSYSNVKVEFPDSNQITYENYDSRSIGSGQELVFNGLSSTVNSNLVTKINAAMTSLGYTVLSDGNVPQWRHQGAYVPDNAFPLAKTQTFTGQLFGYYAWYGWPTTDESGWSSLGFNAGLPTAAAFEGPDALPSVYGPHLGIGMGFVAQSASDGQCYFVLAARGTYGNENWKITGTGLTAPLYTVEAEYGELDIQWPGHFGWAWLLPTAGIPLDWYNDSNRSITIQNLDA